MNQTIQREINLSEQKAKSFPIEGTNLHKVLFDLQYRQSFHSRLKKYNQLVVFLYRIGLLPLFGASRTVMLLTTRGRKSAKLRSTPIGYWRIGGMIHLFSAWGKEASWYKNMVANPDDVWIQIGLRKLPVQAQVLKTLVDIQYTLEQFITESPDQVHSLFGWEQDHDRMENANFSEVFDRMLIVRFTEKKRKQK